MATDVLDGPRLVRLVRRHWAYLVLVSLGAAYLITLALLDHRSLGSLFDLGIYDQVVWNLAHGRLFQTTLVYETMGTYDHFEPFLLLVAPLYWLWSDVRVLLIIQSVALALGSLPIYLYARHRFSKLAVPISLALLPAAAYLVYPPLEAANLNDFHEIALLPPLLGMALYGMLTGRRRMLWAFLGVALLVKEDVALTALAFGLYIAALKPAGFRRRDGIILSIVAVAWFLLVLYVFYPAMTRGMPFPFIARRFAWLGGSPQDAARGLAAQPLAAVAHILQPDKLQFLLALFAPLLFLPLLGWPIIVLAAPVLGYLLLSDYQAAASVTSYYNPPLLPILFFAMIHACVMLVRRAGAWRLPARPVLAGVLGLVLIMTGAFYVSLLRGPVQYYFVPRSLQETELSRAAAQLSELIPPEASLSTEWPLVSTLSHRQRIYTTLSRPLDPPEYRLVYVGDPQEREPIYPFAAPDDWPPVYYEYEPVAAQGPLELSKLKDSATLEPLQPVDPQPSPMELAAYGWLGQADPKAVARVKAGETARLMLAWRRTGQLDRRYVFFVHVLREGGPGAANGLPDIVTQSGHEPGQGHFPTIYWDTWTRPSILLDEQDISFPPGTQPGPYYVWAGAFDKETGERVPLGGEGKTLRLVSTIEVTP